MQERYYYSSRSKVTTQELKRRVELGRHYNRLQTSAERKAFEQTVLRHPEKHDDLVCWARIARRFGDDPVRYSRLCELELPFHIIMIISSIKYSDEEVDRLLQSVQKNPIIADCKKILDAIESEKNIMVQEPLITVDVPTEPEVVSSIDSSMPEMTRLLYEYFQGMRDLADGYLNRLEASLHS